MIMIKVYIYGAAFFFIWGFGDFIADYFWPDEVDAEVDEVVRRHGFVAYILGSLGSAIILAIGWPYAAYFILKPLFTGDMDEGPPP